MRKDTRPVWKRAAPPGGGTRLTAPQKAAARRRAEEAGRRYPNLVDNLWALKLPPDGGGQS
jgi:ribosomal protein L15E